MGKIMIDKENLAKYFEKSPLVPAIVQDIEDGTVLMLAYMNEQSLRLSLETGETWFFSRSRGELWNKGATSGNKQKIIEMYSDCDDDTLLVKVKKRGPACHTGKNSCFFNKMFDISEE